VYAHDKGYFKEGTSLSHTIELRNVSKYYAGEDSISMGFSRVSLELDIGEFVVITGESGSGKSTLLNVISGLDTYEEGEMFVCGEDTTAFGTEEYENYRKTYIGNIFQDFNLINSYTVYQNIEAVMLLSGKKKAECKGRVDMLIDMVGLAGYSNTKASKLSGGQKQRVAIARALAKDAPIIVADEPTGNLDSESAQSVMELLAEVSKDKLVIIVTHNYEQAEPYVTRKITMHDGSIIEDRKLIHAPSDNESQSDADRLYESLKKERQSQEQSDAADAGPDVLYSDVPVPGRMKASSEIRLGVRNAFNIPTKFILLLLVYLFVSTAILSQYASTKNSMHESDMLGTNFYFTNTRADRLIVKKADESSFTDADFAAIQATPNIRAIAKNDLVLDRLVSMSLGDFFVEGAIVPLEQIKKSELTFGHMPRNDYEIVIRIDASSDAYINIYGNGDAYIGSSITLTDLDQQKVYDFAEPLRISGIILDEDISSDSLFAPYGYSNIYTSDRVSRELLASMMASESMTELDFGGVIVPVESGRTVLSSENVPDGSVYLFEDQEYYYKDEEAEGKDFGLTVKNRFFESKGSYTVAKVITKNNCKNLVGIPKDEFDKYYNCVFVSKNDFRNLFEKGYYQISAFMTNEQLSDDTRQALKEQGYRALPIKETLTDSAGEMGEVIDFMTYGRLALEFIILFIVAYAVIRQIMRSRNSYYSILRMLGADKKNIDNILRVELVFVMALAYGIDVLFATLVSNGVLQKITGQKMDGIAKMLYYLTPADYTILGAALILMSLLIANIYSRNIFAKSAMKAFREEV
jgi:ABC-type lipoprotein export system ATPase subunit